MKERLVNILALTKGNNHAKCGTSKLTWRLAGPRAQDSKMLGMNGPMTRREPKWKVPKRIWSKAINWTI